MKKLFAKIASFRTDESGVTAIEYGLIAAAVAIAITAAVFAFGDELDALFDGLAGELSDANAELGG